MGRYFQGSRMRSRRSASRRSTSERVVLRRSMRLKKAAMSWRAVLRNRKIDEKSFRI